MSVTITVQAGLHVRVVSEQSGRPASLIELMARNRVTNKMLTTEVKAMLLDIMAMERGQTLEEFLSELEAKNARLHKVLLQDCPVQTSRKPYNLSPEGKVNQAERQRRYHERKRTEKATQQAQAVGEGGGA